MSENCNPQNCSSCPSAGNCNSQPKSMLEEPNKMSNIGKVIGVVSLSFVSACSLHEETRQKRWYP